MMIYNEIVRACFFTPKHVGCLSLKDSNVVHYCSGQAQKSAVIDIYMACDERQIVKEMCFKTNGNPFVIAALEWLCRDSQGRAFQTLGGISYQTLISKLEIPLQQSAVALQVEDAYKEILHLMAKKLESKK